MQKREDPVDRYREQVEKWRVQFSEKGYEIARRHDRYPLVEERYLRVPFFQEEYLVDLRTGEILDARKAPCALSDMSRMMIYSHLCHLKKDAAASGRPVSYEAVKGNSHVSGWSGKIREETDELCRELEKDPEAVRAAVKELGGEPWDKGDVSFCLTPFEGVKFYYIFWRGDDEFPSDLRTLYDENIMQFMHQESIIILGSIAAERILKLLERGKKK